MVIYLIFFLGGFSPIHCRMSVTFAGLICIYLSVFAGSLLGELLGYEPSDVHQCLPILMIGIGVDDMFVICTSLDQVSLDLSPGERIKKALRHSGPSITITSFTNSLAFLSGSYSILKPIQSFCIHASIMILLLYLSALTIFISVLYWDAKRVHAKMGECCGLFACKEDSIFFLKGKLLTNYQRKFSNLSTDSPNDVERED